MGVIDLTDATHVVVVRRSAVAPPDVDGTYFQVGLVMGSDFSQPHLMPFALQSEYGMTLAGATAYAEELVRKLHGGQEVDGETVYDVPIAKITETAITYEIDPKE